MRKLIIILLLISPFTRGLGLAQTIPTPNANQGYSVPDLFTLTNDSLNITGNEAYVNVCISAVSTSTVNGIVRGVRHTVNGKTTGKQEMIPGAIQNFGDGKRILAGLRIVAPANCTILVTCYK